MFYSDENIFQQWTQTFWFDSMIFFNSNFNSLFNPLNVCDVILRVGGTCRKCIWCNITQIKYLKVLAPYLMKYYVHGLTVAVELTKNITSVNKVKMIISFISKMAEGRQGSSTSDGAASRMNNKAMIDFLLESDSDLWSLSEESSYEEDENDISMKLKKRL